LLLRCDSQACTFLQELATWCLSLLQTHSAWQQSEAGSRQAANGAAHQSGASGAAAAEDEAERAGQLKALLKLLMNLTQSFDSDASHRLAEVCSAPLPASAASAPARARTPACACPVQVRLLR
jgi:hypothetical protein